MAEMSKQEIRQLLRISECEGGRLASNKTLQDMSKRFNLGVPIRANLLYSASDIATARRILAAQGVDHQLVTHDSYGMAATGSDALVYSKYEKHVSQGVKHARVSIKSLPGKTLNLDQDKFPFRKKTHLDVSISELTSIGHDSFIVVENYETFDDIHRVSIEVGNLNPLVVYRGDPNESRADFVNQLLKKFGFPVYVFGDLDPRGLVIAAGMPNFAALLLPRDEDLEHMLNGIHRRGDLYSNQVTSTNEVLEGSPYPCIRHAWSFIKRYRGGLVQQVWLGKPYSIGIRCFEL